ncbi:MAG: aminomethyl-transferring glycine dehydrogenase subunit GcvPB [bacterium]
MTEPLIFELNSQSKNLFGECDVPNADAGSLIPADFLNSDGLDMPDVAEIDIVRHFTHLARLNYCVDEGFYPLGSCTMKYNPKVHEDVARYTGFSAIHPYQPEDSIQGTLQLLSDMESYLCQISGMDSITLQPAAGAHGESTGLMLIKAYYEKKGEGAKRRKIIIPDSSHGTNPASTTLCGYEIVEVKSDASGNVDLKQLLSILDDSVAALMLTNPNTLGLFEEKILDIADMVHKAGGLLYYDGANLNALLGVVRPGDMGFDVMHFNLHKTFSTPHGSGGPGSGPVGVKKFLEAFLPYPTIENKAGKYYLNHDRPDSIGKVKSFYGNFSVIVKAYAYVKSLGAGGLKEVAYDAVLNANYIRNELSQHFNLPYDRLCMHEFVMVPKQYAKAKVRALDIAKRMIDYGYHPPTIYFPLIVQECLMVEPTETESKATLDNFVSAMKKIAEEAQENPDILKASPHCDTTSKFPLNVARLNEAKAARELVLTYRPETKVKQ